MLNKLHHTLFRRLKRVNKLPPNVGQSLILSFVRSLATVTSMRELLLQFLDLLILRVLKGSKFLVEPMADQFVSKLGR